LRTFFSSGFLIVVGFILVSCRPAEEAPSMLPTATVPPTMTEAATISPTNTATIVPAPAATLTPMPTVQPTETPLPIIRLSVPPEWLEWAEQAVEEYEQEQRVVEIQVTDDEQAEIRLVREDGAFVVKREPLVLTVPFTSEWQDISVNEALVIMDEGHDQIKVMRWSEKPVGMRALRVDSHFAADDDYPFQDIWSLQAAAGYEAVAEELLPALQAASAMPLVHLAAVGDIMLDRSLGAALENGYLAYPFAKTMEELRGADITIGNVESALGDMGEPAGKRYPFRAPPQAAKAMALAGFDIVSLANNHAGDYGFEALLQAIDLLEAQGIAPIGAGSNAQEAHAAHVTEVDGLKIAFFAYVDVPIEASTGFDTASWTATSENPGIAWADPAMISAGITAVHDEVDLVVVALHSGFEYQAAPSEPQTAAARAAVDAGADLVIGHHTHILQGIEFYGDGVIIYGTGNFAFEIDGPPETALFDIWLDKYGVRQIEINPAVIQFGGQPRLAESWEDAPILNQVYYLTNILNAQN